ncbi:hypothetical protein HY250_00855 [Candidatus Azambacteria bacterium]|nr:hypothetical protein [Candidatus Azambacteria bacterium]MBI3684941.1 hypothetical protein [Candidatus Azambacteria bacterium]
MRKGARMMDQKEQGEIAVKMVKCLMREGKLAVSREDYSKCLNIAEHEGISLQEFMSRGSFTISDDVAPDFEIAAAMLGVPIEKFKEFLTSLAQEVIRERVQEDLQYY